MDRFKSVRLASIIGICANIFLFVIKIIIGIICRSQSMIADAYNSGGDIVSSFITYIGNKIASKNADEDHNLGHGKAEYIYSMIMCIIMIILTFSILKNSFISIINKQIFIFSKWLIVVCLITILTKLILFIYTNKIAKKQNNILIRANSIDHRNDCLLTFLTLVSCIFSCYNIFIVDGIIGIFISIWIILSYISIFLQSYDVLMDKSISEDTKNKVLDIIKEHKEIKKIQHFVSTPVGYKYQICLTIFVDGNLSTFHSHEIADKLEKEINDKIDEIYLTVIHVNPLIENKKD